MTNRKAFLITAASFGVPAPNKARIRIPRLWPATWTRYRLWTFSRPAEKNLAAVGLTPTPEDPCDIVADKGYHSRDVLKDLDDSPWKTRIAEPRPSKGYLRWHGDDEARAAVYANRNRLRSGVGKEAMRKRGEVVERSFAHVLERGGMRRTWLRGRENVHKRYLVHVAGHNLGILMRALFGAGTPKEAAVIRNAFLFVIQTAEAITA